MSKILLCNQNIRHSPYTTGNLGAPTAKHSYSYGDSNWKDKLTGYDGRAITYDEIGNPLSYNGWNMTWEQGNQLAGMKNASNNIGYKYNSDGIRTQKTVNGNTTNYYIQDGDVAWETNGSDTIHYTYDANGDLAYMNLNGQLYYYERDAQNDIIGLVDSNMNEVVTYSYDTWGRLLNIGGSLAATVGVKNPYRYRGYRYDTETGLYYLSSRYYDPDTCRMINADDTDQIASERDNMLDDNLFAYGNNDPVMLSDPSGSFAIVIVGTAVVVVGIVILTCAALSSYSHTRSSRRAWNGLYRSMTASINSIRNGIHYRSRHKGRAGRPELKKQGREGLEKKKADWKENPNKRQRIQPRPHHPSNRGHRKYNLPQKPKKR